MLVRVAVAPGLLPAPTNMERAFTKILQDDAAADARNDDSRFERRTAERYFAVDEKGSVASIIAPKQLTGISPATRSDREDVGSTRTRSSH